MNKIKWDRKHHSRCGRFWCRVGKRPPGPEGKPLWYLYDESTKSYPNGRMTYACGSLKGCKELAERILADEQIAREVEANRHG